MMTPSTKRAIRTTFHVLIAVLTAIPVVVATSAPTWAVGVQIVAVAAIVSKTVNALEDAGVIPSWLKA
jgi:hypothetical protein